ncbi:oligosaccharyl transferase [Sorangium cellulosum]|uniref:Oligosaccharyl transferase n=1 Tax=Sorangium cellulosum TaxID=56 RepID=A0A4P2PYQ0_SORCE|nr:oligosaccharide flippase family protein [Sorangium cellulosum]AUX21716.1 oligosaccharyl transferase [Sorangium cellulosum]
MRSEQPTPVLPSAPSRAAEAEKEAPRSDEAQGASLADRIGMIVGGQFVNTLIILVQGVVVVRLLGKAEYGVLAFVTMLFMTGRDLALLYLPESLLYFTPKVTRPELKGLVRQSLLLLLGLGALAALAFCAFALVPSVFLDGREGITTPLLLIALMSLFAFPASLFGPLFIATNNHRKSAGVALLVTATNAAGAIVPAALGCSISWIVAAQCAAQALRLGLSYRLYARLFQDVAAAPFPGGVRAQLAYALPLSGTRFAGLFNQKLDKFVIGLFFSAGLYAEFAVGSQELPLVSVLAYSVASTMLPDLVARVEGGRARGEGAAAAIELWHSGIRKTTLIMLPIAAFVLLFAEPLMRTIYGDAYAGAAVPFRIYSALLPLRVTAYGIMLMALGQPSAILRIQVVAMGVNTAANLVLLPTIGMVGAPLAAVLTQLFAMGLTVTRIAHLSGVGLRGVFPWRHYGRVAATAVVAAAPLVLLLASGAVDRRPALCLTLGAPLYAGLYLVTAWLTGVLAPEDRAFVARWIRLEPLRDRHG